MLLPRCTTPSLFTSVVLISLLVGQSSTNTLAFHPTSKYVIRGLRRVAPRPSCLWSSSPVISADPSANVKLKLESMTVKQLKELLKESKLNGRGILSKLKLKQDLVDFLAENLGSSSSAVDDDSHGNNRHDEVPSAVLAVVDTIITEKKEVRVETPTTNGRMPTNGETISSTKPNLNNGATRTAPLSMPSKKSNLGSAAKDAIFARVYKRYPPVLEQSNQNTSIEDVENDNMDIRQQYHPIFKNLPKSCDMDVAFVGTASCMPGITRGVSCTALRLNFSRQSFPKLPSSLATTNPSSNAAAESTFVGGTWLFDCGECTQLQVTRTSAVKCSKVTKIFITHAHGDHSFGLPGLLCLLGQDRDRDAPPVEIYGPEGLRMWLRVAIRYSVSRIVPSYRVHELKDIPLAPEWMYSRRSNRYFNKGLPKKNGNEAQWGYQGLAGQDPTSWISRANMLQLEPSSQYGESEQGRDIFPIYDHPSSSDGAPVWEVEDEGDVKVFAAPMSHGIPCVGYVVEEQTRPGRLRDEFVKPIVERNFHALKEAGFGIPMKLMAVIKNLPVGSAFTFPDGTIVSQEDAVEPPRKGRKVVICGDTANCRAIAGLAQDADVLIHEATNSYLAGIDKDTDLKEVTRDATVHGHSTPYMAGEFAKRVRAKRLVLNHFSARYKGDCSVDSLSIMMRIEGQALKASGLKETEVAAAWDFMVLPIPQN